MKKIKILIPVMFIIGAGLFIILSFGIVIVYLPISTPPSYSPVIIDCTDGDDTVEIIKDASDTFSIYLNGYLCNIIILTEDESSMNDTCNTPVYINLGEGNDTCKISYCYPGALTIMCGPGNDTIIPDDYTPPDISSLSLQVPEVKEQQYKNKSQDNEARLMNPIDTSTSTGLVNTDAPFSPSGYIYKAWVLIGEEGNDILVGGPGADFLLGGLGNDFLYLRIGADTAIDRFGYNTFLTYGNSGVIIDD